MSIKTLLISAALCYLSLSYVSTDPAPSQYNDPAVFYTMVELVCSEGYPIQEFKLVTEDGYVLRIFRIPNNRRRPKVPRRRSHYQRVHTGYHPDFQQCVNESVWETAIGPPVLLAHGLFSTSDNWVLQGPGSDLAYLLVDAGYDVWFTNVRGNFYSRKHLYLSPTEYRFWDFSFHELGTYDIPTIIDFVLNATGYKKLSYVGHSMGTTMFFVMGAVRPDYNDKIEVFVGMTPISQIKEENFTPARDRIFETGWQLVKAVKRRGVYEFGPRTLIPILLSRSFCGKGSPIQNLCYDFIFSFAGYPSKLFLRKKLPVYLAHGLGGSSIKSIEHYHQLFYSSAFQQYDYGPEENFARYGQAEPPKYDLRKVTAPVALYYSDDDYVVDPKDVDPLINILPNIVEIQRLTKYSHVDFLWAYNAKDLIYGKILALMGKMAKINDVNNSINPRAT